MMATCYRITSALSRISGLSGISGSVIHAASLDKENVEVAI